jgi:hypothetical protein
MFPQTKFVAANAQVRTFIEAAKELNKKYKNLIMVAGSDRIPEYEKLLNKYNGSEFHFDTIQVVSAGERDPDADDASGMSATKMRSLASKGDFEHFKKGLPSLMRDIDGKRLMNDIRLGMGLEVIKEQINLVKDDLREQYFRGEIFNIGDVVESSGKNYTIVKRGANHLLLKETTGNLVSKWIQDVTPTAYKEKGVSEMNEELTDKTLRPNDKIKVARMIATILGIETAESSSNAESLVNNALRKVRGKALNAEALNILNKMLTLATEVGIEYETTLKPTKLKEATVAKVDTSSNCNIAGDIMSKKDKKKLTIGESWGDYEKLMESIDDAYEDQKIKIATPMQGLDMTPEEKEIEDLVNSVSDDDIMNEYDEDELAIIDSETGEELEEAVNEQVILEVLSRIERMKAKFRMRKTEAKRERAAQIALRRHSSNKVVNKRARRLAVKSMKQRILRGRDMNSLSVGEKERIERILQSRKTVIGRVAMKMVPRIRQLEKSRLSHDKFTKKD